MSFSKGHIQAFFAYLTWGVFPIYWKYLSHISSLEILFHRVIWGCLFVALVLAFLRRLHWKKLSLEMKNQFGSVFSLALLIGVNWLIYIYAVNSNQILQGSLAYFITPLLNVALGALIFNEKISPQMKWATGLASLGVFILVVTNNTFPWVALSLASSFSVYGVIKKRISIGGIESTLLENLLLLLPSVLATLWLRSSHQALEAIDWALLAGGGMVTAIPILLFSLSARKIPFNHLGILQFLAPTLQFLIGYFVYSEPVSNMKWAAFVLVWIGVAIYLKDIITSVRISSLPRNPAQ